MRHVRLLSGSPPQDRPQGKRWAETAIAMTPTSTRSDSAAWRLLRRQDEFGASRDASRERPAPAPGCRAGALPCAELTPRRGRPQDSRSARRRLTRSPGRRHAPVPSAGRASSSLLFSSPSALASPAPRRTRPHLVLYTKLSEPFVFVSHGARPGLQHRSLAGGSQAASRQLRGARAQEHARGAGSRPAIPPGWIAAISITSSERRTSTSHTLLRIRVQVLTTGTRSSSLWPSSAASFPATCCGSWSSSS